MKRIVTTALLALSSSLLLVSCGSSSAGGGITLDSLTKAAWYGQCHSLGSDSSAECFTFSANGNVAVKILTFSGVTDCSSAATVNSDTGTVTLGDVLSDGSTALDVALTGVSFYSRMKFVGATTSSFNVGKQAGATDDGSSAANRFTGLATDYAFVEQSASVTDCSAFDDTIFP